MDRQESREEMIPDDKETLVRGLMALGMMSLFSETMKMVNPPAAEGAAEENKDPGIRDHS